jgi:hypothetical protein
MFVTASLGSVQVKLTNIARNNQYYYYGPLKSRRVACAGELASVAQQIVMALGIAHQDPQMHQTARPPGI